MCGELQPQPLLELVRFQLALCLVSVHRSGVSCSAFSHHHKFHFTYTATVWHVIHQLRSISLPGFLFTLHPVPGPVSKLSYEEDTETSVSITWNPPKEPNGVIRAYFVEHVVYQNESTTSVTVLAGGPMYTVIQGLSELLPFQRI